jgi:hypothetical protein
VLCFHLKRGIVDSERLLISFESSERERRAMAGSHYLSGLSISSLDSDEMLEQSDIGSTQTAELCQRLQDLEEHTANFLLERPIALNMEHDSFTDIDLKCSKDFEFKISDFRPSDVLSLSVLCIPDCMIDNPEFWVDERPVVRHRPLELILKRKRSSGIPHERGKSRCWSLYIFAIFFMYTYIYLTLSFSSLSSLSLSLSLSLSFSLSDSFLITIQPSLHNGEYSYILTTAHGMSSGSYILNVDNFEQKDGSLQPVRVSLKIFPVIKAVALGDGRPLQGRVEFNEFRFYRFISQDPSMIISFSLKPICGINGDVGGLLGDVDLYVTNRLDLFLSLF